MSVSTKHPTLPLPYHDIMKLATEKQEDADEEEEEEDPPWPPHEGRASSANVPPKTGLAVKSAPV